jgi:UDP-N-acetyl-D-glucosamine dehydrogenase
LTPLLDRIDDRTATVAVVGQGYVGLVVSMRASEAGFPVIGLEVDQARAQRLVDGDSYIEDVPAEVLRAALDRGYRPTSDPSDLEGVDVAVISVPTPLSDGIPDLSYIESAGRMVASHLRPGALVILESTTYPGTTEELLGPILEQGSGLRIGDDLLLGYSPERIDPGNPAFGLHNTPKIVAGVDEPSLAAVDAFFSTFVEQTVPVTGCGEAELAKIIENTFRHVNIALVNELAMFANGLGVDVNEAIGAAATKPFGFMRFTPGPGVGGHCLPIDPTYLSWRIKRSLGESFRFIELANDVNEHMPHYVAGRITAALNRDAKAVNGSRILVLGVSYKPNVGDARETPATPMIAQLVELGAEVIAVDPHVDPAVDLGHLDAKLVADLDESLLATSDLAVIITDHDAFDYEMVVRAAPRVLDTRDRIPGRHDHVERL